MSAQLTIPRDPAFVGLARLVVAQAARLAGVSQDRVQDVKIAVAEAVAAVTGTERPAGADSTVQLQFGMTNAGFEVTVIGPSTTAPSLDDHADDAANGGDALDLLDPKLGLTLIEGLTDDFESSPQDGQQRLRFVVGAH